LFSFVSHVWRYYFFRINTMDSEQELISRATELRDLLESNASRTEAERRVPEENMQALEAAGLMELMLPAV
jgi:3-hydroxy-9,10-secoandrosta-1,3,5(10)-triene-9,17-dione monooxygenase